MNRAQTLYLEIQDLEIQLKEEQSKCNHPNLNLDEDDLFSDPFAVPDGKALNELQEYRCPDCLEVFVQ